MLSYVAQSIVEEPERGAALLEDLPREQLAHGVEHPSLTRRAFELQHRGGERRIDLLAEHRSGLHHRVRIG
jgi:hypothetical protein